MAEHGAPVKIRQVLHRTKRRVDEEIAGSPSPPGCILCLMALPPTPHSQPPAPEAAPPEEPRAGGIPTLAESLPAMVGSLLAVVLGGGLLAALLTSAAFGPEAAVAGEGRGSRGAAPLVLDVGPEVGPCSEAACVRARLAWGEARQRGGALVAADSLYALAREEAAAAGFSQLEAEALFRRSATRLRLEGLAPALLLLDASEALVDEANPVQRAVMLCQRGSLLATAGAPGSEEVLEAGLLRLGVTLDPEEEGDELDVDALLASLLSTPDRDSSRPPAEEATALDPAAALAGCLWALGQVDARRARTHGHRARRHLLASAEVHARLGNTHAEAAALQWLGSVYRTLALLPRALSAYERAIEAAVAGENPSAEAWARAGRAAIHADLGDRAMASREFSRARESMVASGDRFGLAFVARLEASEALWEGRVEAARELVELAQSSLEALGDPRAREEALPLYLAVARTAGDPDEIEARIEELLRATGGGRAGLQSAIPRHLIVAGLLETGQVERARDFMAEMDGAGSGSWLALYAWAARKAEVAARLGDVDGAATHLHEALGWLSYLRDWLYEADLRGGVLQLRNTDLQDPDLGMATVIAVLADGGMPREAFAFASELRARELEADRIRNAALSPEEVREAPPEGVRGGTEASAVQEVLSPTEAVFFYETGWRGEPTTLFVVTQGSLRTYRLEALDSLAPLVGRLETLLLAGEEARPLRRRLGDLLLAPALAELPGTVDRLLLVPAQGLHALPFEALLVEGSPEPVPLLSGFEVAYLPSPGLLVALRAGEASVLPRARGVLALGFGAPATAPDGSVLPRLRWVTREARAAARALPESRSEVGRRATVETLLSGAEGGWAALHVAAHAHLDTDLPARSALYLAPARGDAGVLPLATLERAHLPYRLVVLSACTTAGGVEDRGEGIRGLARAFLGAGAHTVVASPWPVSDRGAARQMTALHAYLAQGLSAAEALARVRREAMATGAPPLEWAAFRLLGDPGTRVVPAPQGP